jgi:hypothetical protein
MFNPYVPTFPMPQIQQYQQQGLQFVNGFESAQMYPLQPNTKQVLMDRNMARFYLAEADASGQKTVKPYDFTPAQENQTTYATLAQFEELKNNYESLAKQLEQLNQTARFNAIPTLDEPTASTTASATNVEQRANHARPNIPSI